jgi:WD40 repeat protein/energy-coupling factor transporter ATP-binding protein EcfA2
MAVPLRIFVSSPGDVTPERRRAKLVIEKLAKRYGRFFALEPILWELEPMLASGHFQDQITPPGETDIVVLIVWSRLGTLLPAKTETREYHGIDGRAPVTGTEWEFEDALAAQKRRGAPDLLAYRKQADPVVSLKDSAAMAAAKEQWDRLEAFWSRWFVDRGQFRAAFSDFAGLDAFEAKLESDLRKLIEARITALCDANQAGPAPVWLSGSPFRGLDAYRFEHAPIFFGRSAMIKAAVEQVTANAENGRAFLLILGASGAGKSSLAQAGVLPALAGRGIVPGVGLWRRAVMRPGGHAAGPFASLAEALVGETALPELPAARQDTAALARHLKASADDPSYPLVAALNQIEVAARARGDLLAIETARLVLVVDQLEELFTGGEITAEERSAFVRCLDRLTQSGRVYVIATMRSDHWHRAAETPQLVAMAAASGRLDLLPATQDEIIEMIRQPAEAAGIGFEADPARGVGLDATLASEAANEPGALPLLSFLLDELYKKDIHAGRTTLTFATVRELGGLKGAIATRAEAVFATLSADVQAALPRALRALVTVSRAGTEPTARAAPLARFADGSAERTLVEALLAPQLRLLVADGDGAGARVRLAHEALLTHWERAKRQIAQDRDDLRTRAVIEEALAEYRGAPAGANRKSKYLLRDPQLANAIDLTSRWKGDFDAETLGFIQASRQRARLLQQVIAAAAAIFAAVAIFAGWQYAVGNAARHEAITQRDLADQKRIEAQQQRDSAQSAQSRLLANLATQRIQNEDAEAGLALALEALPDVRTGNIRPYVLEAESALFRAWQSLRQVRVLAHDDAVTDAVFGAGDRALTVSADKVVHVWDAKTARLIAVLKGHEDRIRSAVFSPNGQRAATASDDKTARIWDAGTGQVITILAGHGGAVMSAEFSPDGRRAVTASADKTARVWDAETGKIIRVLKEDDEVRSASYSPDGRRIVTASQNRAARVWDAETGNPIVTIKHQGSVLSAKFSRDGKNIVTTSDGPTRVWDAQTGRVITTLELDGGSDGENDAAFSPNGQRVLTTWYADNNTSVVEPPHVWDARTGKLIVALEGHDRGVIAAAYSPDGRRIVTASYDRTARIWDAETGHPTATLRGHESTVNSAAFSPDGRDILTASDDKTARVWNADAGGAGVLLVQGVAGVATFSPNGGRMVAPSDGNTASVWDAKTGKVVAVLRGHDDRVLQGAFSPDGRRVVTASNDHTARIWDAETGKVIAVLQGHKEWVLEASFSPDGRRVVTASWDKTARIWNAETGKIIAVLQGHDSYVKRAAFSADGRRVVTASYDHTARIWDAETGTLIATLRGHESSVWSAAFSPDGRRVVTASADKTARTWNADTGDVIAVLRGHAGPVDVAAFSPDGRRVVTASDDHTARIWDSATGQAIAVLTGHEDLLSGAAFSPDGERIVTASLDKTVRIWDVRTGKAFAILMTSDQVHAGAAFGIGGRSVVAVSADKTARIWRVFTATQELVEAAKEAAPRCLTLAERANAFLDPEPPAWCIKMEKWPYQSQDWKDWLTYKRANANPPLPGVPEWKTWVANHAAKVK